MDSADRERCLFLRAVVEDAAPPAPVRRPGQRTAASPHVEESRRHVAETGTVRHPARYGPARRGHRHRVRAGEGHAGRHDGGRRGNGGGRCRPLGDAELGTSTRVEEAAAPHYRTRMPTSTRKPSPYERAGTTELNAMIERVAPSILE